MEEEIHSMMMMSLSYVVSLNFEDISRVRETVSQTERGAEIETRARRASGESFTSYSTQETLREICSLAPNTGCGG